MSHRPYDGLDVLIVLIAIVVSVAIVIGYFQWIALVTGEL